MDEITVKRRPNFFYKENNIQKEDKRTNLDFEIQNPRFVKSSPLTSTIIFVNLQSSSSSKLQLHLPPIHEPQIRAYNSSSLRSFQPPPRHYFLRRTYKSKIERISQARLHLRDTEKHALEVRLLRYLAFAIGIGLFCYTNLGCGDGLVVSVRNGLARIHVASPC
ncbi:unnamed protein product [Vicia faba]|uniref:Transmembrane protein n=1 Tax=Vicia faba TaxID=3906 RepID=A0AAV0ZQJ4_VICFA|nr:unnamed protein product [Vicia faba]